MNEVVQIGFANHFKRHVFPDGSQSGSFSLKLSCGKDKNGEYRKSFINVKLAREAAESIKVPTIDNCRVMVKGRIMPEKYTNREGREISTFSIQCFELVIVSQSNTQILEKQAPQQVQQGNPYQTAQDPQRPVHNNPNQYRAQPAYQQPAPPQGYKPQQPPQQQQAAPSIQAPPPPAPPQTPQWQANDGNLDNIPF